MSKLILATEVEEGMELSYFGGSVIVETVEVHGPRVDVLTVCGQRIAARAAGRVEVLS